MPDITGINTTRLNGDMQTTFIMSLHSIQKLINSRRKAQLSQANGSLSPQAAFQSKVGEIILRPHTQLRDPDLVLENDAGDQQALQVCVVNMFLYSLRNMRDALTTLGSASSVMTILIELH